ncbi:MAG: hypothetical protein ACRYG4_16330 [Janthinobacterium lividum]
MKSTLPPPRRADRTLVPAVLAGVLVAMVGLQFVVPPPVDLPDAGVAVPLRLPALRPAAIAVDPVIVEHALFTPDRRGDMAGAGTGGAGAFGESVAIGVVVARGVARAFLQSPDGLVTAVSPGGSYRGWRLARIGAAGVVFTRGGDTATLPLSASRPPVVRPANGQAEVIQP